MNRFVELCSTTPAKMFGLFPRKGTIAVGSDADIVVFDPNRSATLGVKTLHMNVDYNPYEGRVVQGSPSTVISNGQVVIEGNSFEEPGTAQGDIFRFAAVEYAGSWNVNPALQNSVLQGLKDNTGIDVDYAPQAVPLDSPELGNYPLLWMTGHYDFQFTPEEAAQRKATARAKRRGNQTAFNLVIALVASLGIVLFLVLVVVRPDISGDRSIDYAAEAAAAQPEIATELVVPTVPADWWANRAEVTTAAADGVTTWEIGFITGTEQYIGLTQGIDANPTWMAAQVENQRPTGEESIGGISWALAEAPAACWAWAAAAGWANGTTSGWHTVPSAGSCSRRAGYLLPPRSESSTGTYSGSCSSRMLNCHLQQTSPGSTRGGMARMSTFMFGL